MIAFVIVLADHFPIGVDIVVNGFGNAQIGQRIAAKIRCKFLNMFLKQDGGFG